MAQPPAGPVGSGQAAVPPFSSNEGDYGSYISCVDQAAFRLPDLAPIPASRA
jgi:hypothetical protein